MAKLSRNINDAHPRMQEVWFYLANMWPMVYPDGPRLVLSEVYRPIEVHRAYYAQGREPLTKVNELRKKVDLAPIKESENRIVTKVLPGQSKHSIKPSPAIDVMLYFKNKPVDDLQWYKKMADMAKRKDPRIRWGGDWDGDGRSDDEKLIDGPHLELM